MTRCGGHGLHRLTVPANEPEEVLATGDRGGRWLADHAPFVIPAGVIAVDVLDIPVSAGSPVFSIVVSLSAPDQITDLLAHLR